MYSRALRTTGASIVDEADLTNSPESLSTSSSFLLVIPSSLASSWTRNLATVLLVTGPARHASDPYCWQLIAGYSLGAHRVPTRFLLLGSVRSFRPRTQITFQPLAERRTIEPLFAQGTLEGTGSDSAVEASRITVNPCSPTLQARLLIHFHSGRTGNYPHEIVASVPLTASHTCARVDSHKDSP